MPLLNRAANGQHFVRIGITGSGEDLLVLRWTAADLARERCAGARVLASFGIAAGMRIANTLAGALASPGSLLLGDVVEEMGCLDVPLGYTNGEAAAKAAWELIDRVQPQVLVLDPTSAAPLFAAATAARRDWLQGLVWLQTKEEDPRTEVPASLGFDGWQRRWLAVAEAASFAAGECRAGNLHNDPGVLAEVVDGQLLLTPVERDDAVPRYATGLRARLSGPCSCGGSAVAFQVG